MRSGRSPSRGTASVLAILFLAGVLAGCAASHRPMRISVSDPSYVLVQPELYGHTVTIRLGDGTKHRGRDVQLGLAEITWIDARTGIPAAAPSDSVWRLEIPRRARGGLGGFGAGALLGGLVGLAVGANEGGYAFIAGPIVFGTVGGLLGTAAGASHGAPVIYELNPGLKPAPRDDGEDGDLFGSP